MTKNQGNLCKNCKYRFRRVFIPMRSEKYEDDEGNVVITNGENIIISNQCLIVDIDIDGESTVDCSHFTPRTENDKYDFPLLKHLK